MPIADKRMFCNSCGTISTDGECDCTQMGMAEQRNAEPYVDGFLRDVERIIDRERKAGRPDVANAIEWCVREIRAMREGLVEQF